MRNHLRVLWWIVPAAVLSFGGCARDDGGSWPGSLRQNSIFQTAARGLLTGQAYDRAIIAQRNGDEAALQAAQNDLRLIAPRLAAEQAVEAAVRLEIQAQNESNPQRASALRGQANTKYREALSLSPNFDSRDPNLLNALGYFLAERGTSPTDFATAEKLTRRSLEIWDDTIKNTEDSWVPGASTLLARQRFIRALTARDSLAWALFRQGKYTEALKQQQAAVREAEANAAAAGQPMSADLYYHLGEIYRALKRLPEARVQYDKALAAEPDHELTKQALKKLPPLRKPLPETEPLPDTVPDTPLQPEPLTT